MFSFNLFVLAPGVNPSELYGARWEDIESAERHGITHIIGGWLERRVFKLFGLWHIEYRSVGPEPWWF